MVTMSELQTVGQRLKWLRQQCEGLVLRDLQKICGVGSAHLSKLERDALKGVEVGTLSAICEAYGVTLDWLARGIGKKPSGKRVRESLQRASSLVDEAA